MATYRYYLGIGVAGLIFYLIVIFIGQLLIMRLFVAKFLDIFLQII